MQKTQTILNGQKIARYEKTVECYRTNKDQILMRQLHEGMFQKEPMKH